MPGLLTHAPAPCAGAGGPGSRSPPWRGAPGPCQPRGATRGTASRWRKLLARYKKAKSTEKPRDCCVSILTQFLNCCIHSWIWTTHPTNGRKGACEPGRQDTFYSTQTPLEFPVPTHDFTLLQKIERGGNLQKEPCTTSLRGWERGLAVQGNKATFDCIF